MNMTTKNNASLQAPSLNDVTYNLTEGCGIFAVALSRVFPGGMIHILSNAYGEKWSRRIDFETTHAVYYIDRCLIDVKGNRLLDEIVYDFDLQHWTFDRAYEPKAFQRSLMHMHGPLYGGEKYIRETVALIQKHGAFYALRKHFW
jgi:hypothetical protein